MDVAGHEINPRLQGETLPQDLDRIVECSAFADNSAVCICGRTVSVRTEEGCGSAVNLLPASLIQKYGLKWQDKGGIPQEQRAVQGD